MPFTIERDDDGDFCVFRADDDGDPMGDTFGCHDTVEEAQAQIGAIEASEEENMNDDDKKKSQLLYKSFKAPLLKVKPAQGIVTALVAVFGNIDFQHERIMPGAFTKTITENLSKIRVLDNHNLFSTTDVIGKPLAMREVGRSALPNDIAAKFPDATGALEATFKLNLDTEKGKDVFALIAGGDIDEFSIGFRVLRSDSEEVNAAVSEAGGFVLDADGPEMTILSLREIKLMEFSPVIFGANPATTTTGVKKDDGDEEGDPAQEIIAVVADGVLWNINPATGKAVKVEADTTEPPPPENPAIAPAEPFTQPLGIALETILHQTASLVLESYHSGGHITADQRKALYKLVGASLANLSVDAPDELRALVVPGKVVQAKAGAAVTIHDVRQRVKTEKEPDAGPLPAPTSDELKALLDKRLKQRKQK